MHVRTYVEIEIDARKNENRFFIGRAKYPFDIFGACNIGKYTFEGKRGSCNSGLARFLACVSDRSIDHRRSVIRRELKKKKKKVRAKGEENVYIYNRDAITSRDHA